MSSTNPFTIASAGFQLLSGPGVSAAELDWKRKNQLYPILLTGGIAGQGNTIAINSLMNLNDTPSQQNFFSSIPSINGITTVALAGLSALQISKPGPNAQLDGTGADFIPAAGGTLINNQVATYPFANQAVAANAVIAQPLNISMMMLIPVTANLNYPARLALMLSLVGSLKQHIQLGGLFSVITSAYIYTYCILTMLRDVSGGETNQAQYRWQWDFFQPLVTQQAANQAQNNLMQAITNGTPTLGTSGYPAGLPVNNPLTVTGLVQSPTGGNPSLGF